MCFTARRSYGHKYPFGKNPNYLSFLLITTDNQYYCLNILLLFDVRVDGLRDKSLVRKTLFLTPMDKAIRSILLMSPPPIMIRQ